AGRTDTNICPSGNVRTSSFKRINQRRICVGQHLVICVGKGDVLPTGRADSTTACTRWAFVWPCEDRYRLSTVRMLAGFLNGVIGRTIVDDDDFQRHTALAEDALQTAVNELTRVECRNDHTQRRSVRAILTG